MTRGIRLVAPFRPFMPENVLHQEIADFDWIEAIRMLSLSAEAACGVPVQVITDHDTTLPLQTLHYATTERRLMLWNLEVCLRYLESSDFDRDTVMLDSDQLIFEDLAPFFTYGVDLGLLVRPTMKHKDSWQKVLNGVQFWSVRAQSRLVAFYAEALRLAKAMPEDLQVWGADSEALRQLVEPFDLDLLIQRAGLTVQLIDYTRVLQALSETQIRHLHAGRWNRPTRAVLDFRWTRKQHMRPVFEASFPTLVEARV